MKTVPLHGVKAAGRVALVDDEDYDLVMQYRWTVSENLNRSRPNGPYAVARIPQSDGSWKRVKLHKLLTGYARTDHEDHDGLNNQRYNLRPATVSQNLHNGRARTVGHTSRFKGVGLYRRPGRPVSWRAFIRIDGHLKWLGSGFKSEEDAAHVYDAAAREAFGEYACLNFPEHDST